MLFRNCLLASAVAAFLVACGGSDNDDNHQPNPGDVLNVTKVDGRYHNNKDAPAASASKAALALAAPAARITLPALDLTKNLPDAEGTAFQIAMPQAVPDADSAEKFAQLLQWTQTADGRSAATLELKATDSFGIRLGLLVQSLPQEATLHVYTAEGQEVLSTSGADILALIQRNADAGDTSEEGRTWWSPDLGGDNVSLTIELPAGVDSSAVQLALPRISNAFVDVSAYDAVLDALEGVSKETIPTAQSCNLDVSCYNNGAAQRDAVARMRFVRSGSSYLCTGTLLNDAIGSDIPYFITANHCISTQTVASTLQTDWFFRTNSCNANSLDGRRTARTGGARLLFSSNVDSGQDTTLMALNDPAPAGTYLAGWDAQIHNRQQDVYGIHHPAGALAKIAGGAVESYAQCTSRGCDDASQGRYYEVTWGDGTTQSGSSGSALFTTSNHVIGVLHGGYASCTSRDEPDYYGRLDLAFESGMKTYLAASRRPL